MITIITITMSMTMTIAMKMILIVTISILNRHSKAYTIKIKVYDNYDNSITDNYQY